MPSPGISSTWGREGFSSRVLAHLQAESVLLRSGARRIDMEGSKQNVPRLNTSGDASWTAEGAEIASNAPDADEVVLVAKALKNVVSLSNEAIDDNEPDTLNEVERALARALATRLDTTVFDAAVATALRPAGLRSTAYTFPGAAATAMNDAAALDLIRDGAGAIRDAGGDANAVYMNSTDLTALTKLKEATGSNKPLLAPENDATQRPVYRVAGAWLYGLPSAVIPAGAALVAQADQIVVGVRKVVDVKVSSHAKFTADSVVVRVVGRFDVNVNDTDGFYHLT